MHKWLTEKQRTVAEVRGHIQQFRQAEMTAIADELEAVLAAAVKLREALATAMRVHIMDDEQIDGADDLLAETAWLAEGGEDEA